MSISSRRRSIHPSECPFSAPGYPPLTAETPHAIFRVQPIPAHSSRGPGRRPLTAVTRVQIPYALPTSHFRSAFYRLEYLNRHSLLTPTDQHRVGDLRHV